MINLIFFGGGRLLASILKELNSKKYLKKFNKIAVVSDRHKNEIIFKNLTFKKFLDLNNINYLIANKISKSLVKKFKKNSIGISLGAPWIFKRDFIKWFNGNFFNIHGSDLPQDKGGGGFSWQILLQRKKACATIHKLESVVDNGDIIFQNKFYVADFKSPQEIQLEYEKKTKQFFLKKINKLVNMDYIGKKQSKKNSSYWPRLKTDLHGWIDWNWNAKEIVLFIKAFEEPYIGAHTKLNNKKVYLKNCLVKKSKNNFHPFQTGIIFKKDNDFLNVCCGRYIIKVGKIFDKKKNLMLFKNIKVGDRFYTPRSFLDKALSTRVFYTPKG